MNVKLIIKYLCYLVVAVLISNVFTTDWQTLLTEAGIYAKATGKGISVSYLDVGTADCSFISADGYNVLIDAGVKYNAEEIATFLDRYGIEKLDMVIASHSDSDHIGGMDKVLDTYKVDRFVAFKERTEDGKDSVAVNKLNNSLEENNINVTYTKAGETFALGKMTLNVLSPNHEYGNSNDDSLVIKVSYGETDFLFTGDASKEVEKYLLENKVDVSSEVLKVAHHGSQTGTTDEFLEEVNPAIAVVSVGENFFNLPNIDVMRRLREYENLELYRCDDDGTVTVNSDGEKITVTTEK